MYKDPLTGGLNRAKYEEDIDAHLNENRKFKLVFMDINNLKMINDQQGHSVGDNAIKIFYEQMENFFCLTEGSYCYRIGGDEFAIIMDNSDMKVYDSLLKQFQDNLKQVSANLIYQIEGAVASDVYDFSCSFAELKRRVDLMMYEHKQLTKKFKYR